MTEKLIVVAGPMFSGKTNELHRLAKRLDVSHWKGQVFKPSTDDRYDCEKVASHDGNKLDATPVVEPEQILGCLEIDVNCVIIDEVQFFNENIVLVVKKILEKNIQVIVAGLPTDFRGEPFGPMPTLMALADHITLLNAICTHEVDGVQCNQPATKTQRIINDKPADYNDPIKLVGGVNAYQARCSKHHIVPGKPVLK